MSSAFVTPWTVVQKAPLSKGFGERILDWVPSSGIKWVQWVPVGLSQPLGSNLCLLHCRQILHAEPPGSPSKGSLYQCSETL